MRKPPRRRHGVCSSGASTSTFSLRNAAASLFALASLAPVSVHALNATAAPSPNIKLDTLGRIGIAGDFSGVSIYEYEGQNSNGVSTNGSEGLMARLPNGALTTVLRTDASIVSMCSFVAKDSNETLVVLGGNFTSINGEAATAMALFNPNTTEVTSLPGISGQVNAVYCDQDSSLVYVGGTFTGGNSTNALVYVVGSGFTDLSFAGFNGPVTAITKAANGNIIFGGSFTGLGNTTTTSSADARVVDISSANITSTSSSTTAGFSDPNNIVCKTSGADGSGNTWLLADDTAGSWEAQMEFMFKPNKLRLWNTHQDNRGTKTWRFTAMPLNGILNFTYIDPSSGANASCTSECPLSHDTSVTYQDFYFVNNVGMNAFRIDISDWFGSGGGLNGIELFEDDITSFAINRFNEPNCTASATDFSSSTSTGPWTESPSFESSSRYLTADLASPISSSSASVVFSPGIRQSGNYSINIYTPGCTQDGSCDKRGQVNVTVSVEQGKDPIVVQLYQTNLYDKYDQLYFGSVDASGDSFRPTVTLTPLSGQSMTEQIIVAQSVGFILVNSTGGLNGLYEYDVSNAAADSSDFNQSTFDSLGSTFSSNSAVSALATGGDITYIAGNFSSTNVSNIVSVNSQTSSVVALSDGLNGRVSCLLLNGTRLFAAGRFTGTKSGSTADLNNIAVYDTAASTWSAVGAGVNGPVINVAAMTMNITNDAEPDVVFAFTGGFDTLLSFGSSPSVSVSGFGVWVPSQNSWLQNVNGSVESVEGVLLSSLLDVPDAGALYGGALSYSQVGSTGVAGLRTSGLESFGVNVLPSNSTSSTSSSTSSFKARALKRDTLVGTSVAGVITGAFDTSNNRNKTILAGHFTANTTAGTITENLLIVDNKNNGAVSGLPSGIDNSTTFVAVAVTGDSLFAGGNVSGTVNSASVSGLISYNLATDNFNTQPPSLSGGNGTVTSIRVRPSTSDVYVGGTFQQAGSLGCPAVCYYSTSGGQWNRPGTNLASGSVNSMVWTSNTLLVAGGSLMVNATTTIYLAQYDASRALWDSFPGAAAIPGPVDILALGSSDGSQLWVAGTSTNGSLYLMKYNGNTWVDALGASGQTLSSGTNIRGLQVFSLSSSHDATSVLDASQDLVLTGSIVLPSYGTVAAAVFDGKTFAPYLLTTNAGNAASSISSIFVENDDFFTASNRGHLPLVGIVLIGLAISLGLMLIIVAAGLLLDRLRKKQQGYMPAPAMYERGAGMARIPPQELFQSLGRPGEAPRV